MKFNREDAGEMYLPDDQGEYMPKVGTQNFSIQGLLDTLMSLESDVTVVQTPVEKRDALLKKYLGSQADTEEGHMLFHVYNSLVLSKGLLYLSTTPKGEMEGVLAFLVP